MKAGGDYTVTDKQDSLKAGYEAGHKAGAEMAKQIGEFSKKLMTSGENETSIGLTDIASFMPAFTYVSKAVLIGAKRFVTTVDRYLKDLGIVAKKEVTVTKPK